MLVRFFPQSEKYMPLRTRHEGIQYTFKSLPTLRGVEDTSLVPPICDLAETSLLCMSHTALSHSAPTYTRPIHLMKVLLNLIFPQVPRSLQIASHTHTHNSSNPRQIPHNHKTSNCDPHKMAHKSHAIPWNTLSCNFKYTFSYHSNPQRLDIHPLKKPTQAKELAYFTQAFANQLQSFSVTERAKYESAEYYTNRAMTWMKSYPEKGEESEDRGVESVGRSRGEEEEGKETRNVLSDVIFSKYSDDALQFSSPAIQKVETWLRILNPGDQYASWIEGGDIVKILMMEAAAAAPALSTEVGSESEENGMERRRESIETLLLMANHPRMNILSLNNMHHGHHFGVSRVSEEAVKAYLYMNLLVSMGENGSDVCEAVEDGEKAETSERRRKYMDCLSYERMLNSVAGSYDGDAQTLVHRGFFLADGGISHKLGGKPSKDALADREMLREYLKGLWRVMVTYDVVIREAGGDPDWNKECNQALADMFGVRYDLDT